jgi:hypothetical protein
MKKITNDIAGLRLSKQRKYQIRKMREGRCIMCAGEAFEETLFYSRHHRKRGTRRPGRNKPKPKKWLGPNGINGSSYYPVSQVR